MPSLLNLISHPDISVRLCPDRLKMGGIDEHTRILLRAGRCVIGAEYKISRNSDIEGTGDEKCDMIMSAPRDGG